MTAPCQPAERTSVSTLTTPHLTLIPDIDGYASDDNGDIWSCRGAGGEWRKMRPVVNGRGYPFVGVYVNGRRVSRLVSHLVLMAFVGPRPEGADACHFPDPNPLNNRPDNLRWDTKSENQLDAARLGRKPIGSRMYCAKLTEQDIPEILRFRAQGETFKAIAARFGVCRTTIRYIVAGRLWKHVKAQP